ncbi:neurogenic locus notch homolog protein 1-like isoform X2 [Ruditapes philippinarum]|uniref:neurogenic locus notch homolog protein 1-like isoform X2 n=1 Tax=Ruditapes philippinarum TaxID=129788 RepID=UPI00295C03CE|nr:neurogenic locus notch homolog protein 1-like isoform X2 [Ruditapes philippinarum]
MKYSGIYICLTYLFLVQGALCLVELELSVVQFDNPLGTSYIGQQAGSKRKCCDTGGSNCRTTSDKCDVYFTFCIGSQSNDPNNAGCNGTSIDMEKDVSRDVLKISDNRKLKRFVNVTLWTKGITTLIINVLDIDELPSTGNDPHVFPDLIDVFNKILNFDPAANYWTATENIVSMVSHVSLDIRLRAWCATGWYGKSCDQRCHVDSFHECTYNGSIVPKQECLDPDTLVFSIQDSVAGLQNASNIHYYMVDMLANYVCLKTTENISVNIQEIREHRDGHVDVVFKGFCDNSPVSSLKFREVVYLMNNVVTRLPRLEDYFASPVISPSFHYIQGSKQQLIILVRMVDFQNLRTVNCSKGVNLLCSPRFNISFSWSTAASVISVLETKDLTDCNGDLVDLSKLQTTANTHNSTMLFVVESLPPEEGNITVMITTIRQPIVQIAEHTFSMSELVIGTNFYDSYPIRFNSSIVRKTKLSIEVMAWCGNCRQGSRCESRVGASCDIGKTILQPDCRTDTECKNGGHCAEQKACICKPGWTGPICNTDIDECTLGICTHVDTCTNTRGGYSCTCSKGFTGKNCNVDIDECDDQPCKPGLACLNSYGSYHCIGVCPNNKVNENCTGNVDFCSINPCFNNGTCNNEAFNFTCDCNDGWTDSTCQTNIDECVNKTLCQHGGLCNDSLGSFDCICSNNFTGSYCELDVDECKNSSACRNNGTCSNAFGGYSCTCNTGFTGDHCDSDIDECINFSGCFNGICTNTFGGYSCDCLSGWEGDTCDVDIDECHEPSACTNNATCVNQAGGYACNCQNGFTGSQCKSDIDECSGDSPCLHGDCHNTAGGFVCTCYPGWDGVNCDNDRDECLSSDPCVNGGICVNTPGSFKCNCTDLWNGEHCQIDVNECTQSYACNHNGNCTNLNGSFFCSCFYGWTGQTCNDDVDECLGSVCNNGGTCINNDGGYTCSCPSNWSGKSCDNDIDECQLYIPCKNGGTCSNSIGSYNCACSKTWTGTNCTDDIDECLQGNPCHNGGTCYNNDGSYTCNCPAEWTGSECESDVDECPLSPCANNGTCTNTLNGYSCACVAAWTGASCRVNINECKQYNGICNHGVCSDSIGSYHCDCINGYKGQNCSDDIDECILSETCKNDGTCENTVGSYICHCPKTWSGKNCSDDFNECQNQNPCHNGGTCENENGGFRCICPKVWTGMTCENDVDECVNSSLCLNGGSCFNSRGSFQCNCVVGWEGNSCQTNKDDCLTVQCQNGAKCQDLVNSYSCICTNGYTGKFCETDIDDCVPNPCQNGGKCHDHVDYFECVCPEGWDGDVCSTDVDECRNHPCSRGESCLNNPGSFTCNAEHIGPVSSLVTTTVHRPINLDVFSLKFTGPVSDAQRPQVKNGIRSLLQRLTCHDSKHVYVSLIHNSVSDPNVVEFHAQCDGHHMTNAEVNEAIRTFSDNALSTYFPVKLANTNSNKEKQSWISSNIPLLAGAGGGVLLLVIVIVVVVRCKRKKQHKPEFALEIVEELQDMDGNETITIRNPVYDSMYATQTIA